MMIHSLSMLLIEFTLALAICRLRASGHWTIVGTASSNVVRHRVLQHCGQRSAAATKAHLPQAKAAQELKPHAAPRYI
ncbi:hypothetical protein BDZ85DRAFT_261276 [Elsinoe ampelina]|uniref:Secreted protein n=1 Tax=Elsinoe ampelina TaxID=302913 RepID=A0A6A6GGN7_9PEZI|nr:hypothetical protein BDZ85DRAFT_261276 [Elsinoe ampelina]